jgi:hypothetical protein
MTPNNSNSIVIILIGLITLLVLIGYSSNSLGFKFVHKPLYLNSGFIQDDMINNGNFYKFGKYYDNYATVSTDDNRKEATDDLCGKLLEVCQTPTTKTNTTTMTETHNKSVEEIYKKYIEQGNADNKSFSRPVKIPSSAENISQSQGTRFQLYNNSKLGIKMLYPTGWETKEEPSGDTVRFFAYQDGNNESYIRSVDLFSYPSVSLDQATDSLTKYYNSSLNNFTIEGSPLTSVNANFSSVSLNYTYSDDKSRLIRSMDFIVSPPSNDKTYLFTFRDEASMFSKDLPEVKRMLNSINFSR